MRKTITFILTFTLVLTLAACGDDTMPENTYVPDNPSAPDNDGELSSSEDKNADIDLPPISIDPEEQANTTEYGNISGNISNNAFAVQFGDNIYYVLPTDIGSGDIVKANVDGSVTTVLAGSDRQSCLNIVDGWIYYISGSPESLIYRVRVDGTENTLITSEDTQDGYMQGYTSQNLSGFRDMVVVDDWIYCRVNNGTHTGGIYGINTDNGKVEQLQHISGGMNGFAVYEGWIYYGKSEEDTFGTYRMRTDGSDESKIADVMIHSASIADNKIYYIGGEEQQIHRMDLDGSNIERIADGITTLKINVTGDWIYFLTGEAVYKIKTDGTEESKICDYAFGSFNPNGGINVIDDWIYLLKARDSGGLIMHRVKTDGSELQEVT